MSRVLICGFGAVPGPSRSGVQMGHVMRALAPDHAVDILCTRSEGQAYVERQRSARILRVPLRDDDIRLNVEAYRRALWRQLDGADYDIIHVRDGWSGVPVLEHRSRHGYAVVFDATRAVMAELRSYNLELSAEIERDEEACLLGADLVLAPHEPARRHLAARGRVDRVVVSPPGVDVDCFDYYFDGSDQIDDTRVAGKSSRILYAGTLATGRGIRVLLRGMVQVAARSDARLVLVGACAPGFERSLRVAISDLGLTSRVDWLGPVDNDRLPRIISGATVCVAAEAGDLTMRPVSLYPTKLLEYMACRRAVVAPRRHSVSLVIRDGVHGSLFTPGDPADLAAKILDMLANPKQRQRLAEAGYQHVRSTFTASATRRAVRTAYKVLMSRTSSASGERGAVDSLEGLDGGDDRHLYRARHADDTDSTDNPSGLASSHDSHDRHDRTFEISNGDLMDAEADETGLSIPAVTASIAESPPSEATSVDRLAAPPAAMYSPSSPKELWVVDDTSSMQLATARPETDGEAEGDEGTPIDVPLVPQRVSVPSDSVEASIGSRFVAGEVVARTPRPELEQVLDESAFTAVSVLLGGAAEESTELTTIRAMSAGAPDADEPTGEQSLERDPAGAHWDPQA